MSRFVIFVVVLPFIISGCLFNNDFECGIFYDPQKAGSYTTYPIPDQYVALGDTLFLNVDEYWDYESECNKYAHNPRLSSFIADSREVELHRQENSVFVVGKRTGIFTATVIGDVELTRNGVDEIRFVPMTFKIEVGTRPGNPLRSRALFPATGRIDSILVTDIDKERKALRLLADFSPEYSSNEITDLQARWAFYPVRNIDSLRLLEIPLQTTHEFGNDFYFNPDSLYPFYYGYVEVEPGGRKFGKNFILDTRAYFE